MICSILHSCQLFPSYSPHHSDATTFLHLLTATCMYRVELSENSFTTTAPGVWYKFVGTGETTLFTIVTDYDAQISLYAGESCDMLTCITANDVSFLPDVESAMVEFLESGENYYVFVSGWNKNSGNFELSVESLVPPENDVCSSASALEVGVVVSGDTTAASRDNDLPFCGRYVITSCFCKWCLCL